MSDVKDLMNDLTRRMNGALESLQKEFGGLRTGRASAQFLEPLMVEAYGSMVPMTQVGNISVPEARLIMVQVWDKTMVRFVEKAIRDANLGLNPMVDGQIVRVPMPDLTQERRTELTKIASKYAEEGRISVRNVRRHGMDTLKKLLKDGDISEDEEKRYSKDVQTLTDDYVKKVDDALASKEKDIMQI